MLRANCGEKPEPRYPAKRVGRDIGTSWNVANKLAQLFFAAVWTKKSGFYGDSRHVTIFVA